MNNLVEIVQQYERDKKELPLLAASSNLFAALEQYTLRQRLEGGIEAIYDLLDTTGDFPIKVEEALAKVGNLKLELKELQQQLTQGGNDGHRN